MADKPEKDDWFEAQAAAQAEELENAKAEAEAEKWQPEDEGDLIQGIFLKAVTIHFEDYDSKLALIKSLPDGKIVQVWAGRVNLDRELVDAAPAPGSRIVVRYGGVTETSKGYPVHLYSVRAEREDREYWNTLPEQTKRSKGAADPRAMPPELGPDEAPF